MRPINTQEKELRKSFYKKGQRDYLKKLITEIQERLGVRIIVTRNLHSVESCINGLCQLTQDYTKLNIPKRDNLLIIPKKKVIQEEETHFLKTEIESLNEYISKLEKEKKELEISREEEGILSKENEDLKNKINKLKTSLNISNENIKYFKGLYKEEKLSLEKLQTKKWWQIWK